MPHLEEPNPSPSSPSNPEVFEHLKPAPNLLTTATGPIIRNCLSLYSEYNPCDKLKAERALTWSSCAAHSTKATRTVREALLQQSMAGNKCYRAGELITEPDCQGEQGRAGNNRQSKKKKKNTLVTCRFLNLLSFLDLSPGVFC